MGIKLPNGSTVSIASTYGTAIPATAVTNAVSAVVTAVGHTLADGDVVQITSGWSDINGRVARVIEVDEDTFALELIDTSDAVRFPAGGGVGSVRKVETFQQIIQVLESASAGGEQQFYTYQFVEDTGDERQLPTTRSARSMTLTLGDDPTLPQYAVLAAADLDREPHAIRWSLVGGSSIYFGAYVSVSDMPSLTKNEAMTQSVTLSLNGRPTRYVGAQA